MSYPDFTGKVVAVYLANRPEEHTVVLQSPTFQIQADRLFLVGEFAESTTANDWAAGVTTAVAWDHVEQYLVFDNVEEYFSRLSQAWDKQTFQ